MMLYTVIMRVTKLENNDCALLRGINEIRINLGHGNKDCSSVTKSIPVIHTI